MWIEDEALDLEFRFVEPELCLIDPSSTIQEDQAPHLYYLARFKTQWYILVALEFLHFLY